VAWQWPRVDCETRPTVPPPHAHRPPLAVAPVFCASPNPRAGKCPPCPTCCRQSGIDPPDAGRRPAVPPPAHPPLPPSGLVGACGARSGGRGGGRPARRGAAPPTVPAAARRRRRHEATSDGVQHAAGDDLPHFVRLNVASSEVYKWPRVTGRAGLYEVRRSGGEVMRAHAASYAKTRVVRLQVFFFLFLARMGIVSTLRKLSRSHCDDHRGLARALGRRCASKIWLSNAHPHPSSTERAAVRRQAYGRDRHVTGGAARGRRVTPARRAGAARGRRTRTMVWKKTSLRSTE